MAIYNKLKEVSGLLVNLTRDSYNAYSIFGDIVAVVSSDCVISDYQYGVYYVVTPRQFAKISRYRTTIDLVYAIEQGRGRNNTNLHLFKTPDGSTRVYPKGE